MTDTHLDEAFVELRSLLHDQTPNEDTRAALHQLLVQARSTNADQYHAKWVPYLAGFEHWWSEPLFWAKLRGDFEPLLSRDQPELWKYAVGEADPGPEALSWFLHNHAPLSHGYGFSFRHWSYELRPKDPLTQVEGSEILGFLEEMLTEIPDLRLLEIILHQEHDDWVRLRTEKLGLHAADIHRLASLQGLDGLHAFQLSNDLETSSLVPLTKAPFWSNLRRLDLSRNRLSSASPEVLFPAPMPHLETLNLSHNEQLDVSSVEAIAASPHVPMLRHLEMASCGLDDGVRDILLSSERLPMLKTVILS